MKLSAFRFPPFAFGPPPYNGVPYGRRMPHSASLRFFCAKKKHKKNRLFPAPVLCAKALLYPPNATNIAPEKYLDKCRLSIDYSGTLRPMEHSAVVASTRASAQA
ncbi:hypothetical protein BCY91_03410 [Pelobium manganitolerans]|uniref:Uncharacterized protein n=1 Tax=Pelobium manganitolerans TaxID=1842495 RepID=A0A419S7B0_9SPHI|nr:hypothetical protein BCY91_03410 [Pelobium manganitolerans]